MRQRPPCRAGRKATGFHSAVAATCGARSSIYHPIVYDKTSPPPLSRPVPPHIVFDFCIHVDVVLAASFCVVTAITRCPKKKPPSYVFGKMAFRAARGFVVAKFGVGAQNTRFLLYSYMQLWMVMAATSAECGHLSENMNGFGRLCRRVFCLTIFRLISVACEYVRGINLC